MHRLARGSRLALILLALAGTLPASGAPPAESDELPSVVEPADDAPSIEPDTDPEKLVSLASSHHKLGKAAFLRGDLDTAFELIQSAVATLEEHAPQSRLLAESLHIRGNIAGRRGDLAAATAFLERAVSLRERIEPGSTALAKSLHNLGNVAFLRGDLVASEDHFRRALALRQQLTPGSLGVAMGLNGLGAVAWYRGNLDAAEEHYRQALLIQEEHAPGSLAVATSWNNLGGVAVDRGELAVAEKLHLRALALREQQAADSLEVARSLNSLGEVALKAGDHNRAEAYLERALIIEQRVAPASLELAITSSYLGDVALARSQLGAAETFYQRALTVHRRRAAGSVLEARSCRSLAKLERQRGRNDRAIHYYECAISALESQSSRLGGSDEARSIFGAKYGEFYREAVDLLVEVDQPERAFHVLERYRARELLALLAQRDLVFSSDLPEALERQRRTANRLYEQAFSRWMQMGDRASDAQRQALRQQVDEARKQQDEVRSRIRGASPRLAALQDPSPVDLSTAQELLEPGTVLLSFAVGHQRSHLFVVGPGDHFQVHTLAVGETELSTRLERFLDALRRGRFDSRPEKALLLAQQLSRTLLTPAAHQIELAERLMVLADGPLHAFPLGALASPKAGHRFLIETVPIHVAASATIFGRLKETRSDRRAPRVVAFGDPLFPAASQHEASTAPQLRAATRAGFRFEPLPATREEVEHLRQLFPRASEIYLGAAATEERAKAIDRRTTHLHIATHGVLDDRFPLDSSLAFAIPERWRASEENGLLQAWEIFEQVRLDAELVTLSACDTGRGKLFGGEGLMGLTRAFRYAGARSVLASLWSVSDRSTSKLMSHFYRYLKGGQSKADALRAAQLDLLREAGTSHPFHWAGFQLVGDWR